MPGLLIGYHAWTTSPVNIDFFKTIKCQFSDTQVNYICEQGIFLTEIHSFIGLKLQI